MRILIATGLLLVCGSTVAQVPYPPGGYAPEPTYPPQIPIDVYPEAISEELVGEGAWTWYDPEIWGASFEIGINGTEGNSQTMSFRTAANVNRKTDHSDWKTDLTYAKTNANSVETQNYALFNSGVDWLFADSPWTLFTKTGLQYDEFKAFDLRLAVNAGVGYQVVKSDPLSLLWRFGAGTSREFGGPDDDWVPEGVFGIEFESQITKKQKLTAKTEYFPDWTDFMDYRLVTDFGWVMLIDEEANLSLKLSVTDQYDSTPNGREPNDINYSLLLLWKI